MAAPVQTLKALEEEMGLSGSVLRNFIQDQQDKKREQGLYYFYFVTFYSLNKLLGPAHLHIWRPRRDF